jgi:hypothetical protein
VLVGASALPVASWVSSGSPIALGVAVGWNVIGMLDFALAIGLARLGRGRCDILSLKTSTITALKPTIKES